MAKKSRRAMIATAATAGLASLVVGSSRSMAQLAAFPGAVGYGADATGARADGTGLTVYHVTTLADGNQAGTFRSAVSQPNRIIVFDVGGNIDIGSPISCASNLTILGQTAPGQGVAIYGAETSFYGSSNDIVRYVRFMDTSLDPKGTGTGNSSGNCLNLGNTNNMIFDHVSCEFASYNNIDASGTTGANNLTFSNSIVADPITSQQFNFHWQGNQGTFINNIFTNAHNRSILAKGNTQFVNNTVYDYQAGFTTGDSSGAFPFDIVNNYFISGPATTSAGDNYYQVDGNQTAYAAGNYLDSNGDGKLNGNPDNSTGATVSNAPLLAGTTSLPTLTAGASYAWNIARSGDSLTHNVNTYAPSLGYDEVDASVISDTSSLGTYGRMYNNQDDDGITDGPTNGVGPVASGTIVGANYSTLLNPEGYTEVEAWANGMSDSTLPARVWTASSGNWNTTNNWAGPAPTSVPGIYDIAYVQGTGPSSDGSLTVSTTTPNCYQLYIGGNGGAAGEKVDVTAGGSLSVQDTVTVGYLNNASLQMDGGTARAANIQLGNTVGSTTYTGNLILNAGTLQMQQIVLGGGAPSAWTTGGSITFNGGTIQAIGQFNINAPGVINSAGAIIDTNGNSGSLSGAFSGIGNFTVIGGGTLAVTSNHTYSGITKVSGATLYFPSTAFINSATPSPLGNTSSAESNLVLDGGTLQFNSGGTDHLFDLTANGGTINSSGSGQTTLSNTGVLSPTAAANVTLTLGGTNGNHNAFEPALADPAGGYHTSLTMNGTGLWDLEGAAKTYSGPTTIVSGTLQTLAYNVMSPNSSVMVDSGAGLDFHGNSQIMSGLNGAGNVSDSYDHSTDSLTLGASNGGGSFTGSIGGGLPNLVKEGTGTQILAGSDSYTGSTTVTGGVLQFNQATGIGGTGVSMYVSSGAAVAAGYAIDQTDFLNRISPTSSGCAALAAASANALNFSSSGANLANVSLGAVGTETYTGTLTPYTTNYLLGGGGGTLVLSNANALTGNNTLQVVPSGVVELTATNNYTGITTVSSGGILAVSTLGNGGTASSIGSNSNAAANIVLDGGTLRYIGGGGVTDRSFTLTANGGTLDGSGSGGFEFDSPNAVAFSTTGNTTLTLAGNQSHNNFDMILGDPASGQTSVAVNTSSRWLWVTQSATYSGNTTVQSGELELYGGGYLPSGTGKGNVLVNTGTTFYITANTGINALDNGSAGGGYVTGSGGNLTIGNGDATGTFGGQIAGGIGLVKTGAGTETLTGTGNTFTGTGTISGGTLNVAGSISNASSVTVDGTTSPACLLLSGTNAIPATIPITGYGTGAALIASSSQSLGTINFAGAASFTAGSSTAGTIDGTGTLSVTGGSLTATHIRQTSLTIGSASTVTIGDSAAPGTAAATSVLTDLYNTGTLDLKNNDLIVTDPAQFSTVQNQIGNAYNGGAWNHAGITSSSAKANPGAYGLGYETGAEYAAANGGSTTFDGQPVASGSTIVKYTLLGDTTLSGNVGLGDLNTVLANFNSGTDWAQGNFHYSGTTGLGDLADVMGNFNASASGNLVQSNLAQSNASQANGVKANVAHPAIVPPVFTSSDIQLVVNTTTGDVSLDNQAPNTTAFTGYNIKVIDGTINTLLVGNPADVGKGTGAQGLAPRTRVAPYTKELLLNEGNASSPNYNSSAAALGNNPFAWQVAQDGYNTQTSAFGLAESYLKPGTSDAITIPIGGSVDLGTIFNTLASQTDLQFTWSPTTSNGGNYQGNPFTGIVDYVGGTNTPEPGTLGILGLGGVMMMRRRRKCVLQSRGMKGQ